MRCWGWGWSGQLGYGNTDDIGDDETPARAGDVTVGGPVVELSAGGHHTCARLETGELRCWGRGGDGQLGYGNEDDIGDDETPESAGSVDIGGLVTQLSAGGGHTCALLEGGRVRCWGNGWHGQLGYENDDHVGDDEVPATAGDVNVGGEVVQISAGGRHTCALLEPGNVRCWGLGTSGQLGYGSVENIGDDEVPASAGDVDIGGTVVEIEVGYRHSCALLDNGLIRCWGRGHEGQLGYGNTDEIGDDELPASAGDVDIGVGVRHHTTGEYRTCIVLGDGAARCWGQGEVGQLGYGNTESIGDNETPSVLGNIEVFG